MPVKYGRAHYETYGRASDGPGEYGPTAICRGLYSRKVAFGCLLHLPERIAAKA